MCRWCKNAYKMCKLGETHMKYPHRDLKKKKKKKLQTNVEIRQAN